MGKVVTIYTIGDSHCLSGWDSIKIPGVKVTSLHIGPVLMYSFGRRGLNVEGMPVSSGDAVIFCFGEIDVRCHIGKYKERGSRAVIDCLVEKYFERMSDCAGNFRDKNVKICVHFVPPPVRRGDVPDNPDYPFVGTDYERKQYVQYMNEKLAEKCGQYGFLFVDVYGDYCDSDGFLNKGLSDGFVHIKGTRPLKEFIKRELLCDRSKAGKDEYIETQFGVGRSRFARLRKP